MSTPGVKTCGDHARIIAALSGGVDEMGPRVRNIYDRLMADEHNPPFASEPQIVLAYQHAALADHAEKTDSTD